PGRPSPPRRGLRRRLLQLLPYGDVLAALGSERLAVPAAPALAQAHPGNLRHEIELRGPDITERHRGTLETATDIIEMVRDQSLVGHVVLVDPPMLVARREDVHRLAGR